MWIYIERDVYVYIYIYMYIRLVNNSIIHIHATIFTYDVWYVCY